MSVRRVRRTAGTDSDCRGEMHISHIRLKRIRCFDDLKINLRSRATAKGAFSSLLLLGNNAVGKSTILKSIALGLCDPGSASGLLTDMYGSLIKNGHQTGSIEIGLSNGGTTYTSVTTIKKSKVDPDLELLTRAQRSSKDLPWKQVFVCGYGPTRVMEGTRSYSQYDAADAVYTLFQYGWELQNPELVVRRLTARNPEAETRLLKSLSDVLMMEVDDVTLSTTGLALHNRSGGTSSFGALADGHRSTLNWILDLISWAYMSGREEPDGIVLIDEIENHLHPKWQRNIFRLLSNQFPHIQFIATSHSALPAAGIYDSNERSLRIGKTHVLREDRTGRVTSQELSGLDGWTYDQILESIAFETPPIPARLERAMEALEAAYSGPKSKRTRKYMRALKELRSVSASNAVAAEERQMAEELEAELESLAKKRRRRGDSAH